MNKTKLLGQTFTEYSEIQKMISMYMKMNDITTAKILEPSFGSGHFLIEIIRIIIIECRKKKITDKKISNILNNNIHGFEIDEKFFKQCMRNIKSILVELNFNENVEFKNLKNKTAFSKIDCKFDLIIGNPPYVRVQNFDDGIKQIAKKLGRTSGNTDLFLMFIDYFLNFLKDTGEFIFIVPNTLGKSRSAKKIREWLYSNGSINYYDYEDIQVFPTVSVYSCIFHYKHNSTSNSHFIFIKDGLSKKRKLFLTGNGKIFSPKIINPIKIDINVKNGIATMKDNIYIFNEKPDMESVYPIFKGSSPNIKRYVIFPYKLVKGNVIRFKTEEEFKKTYPKMHKYLSIHKKDLLKRSLEKKTNWFEFGRSQAIKDIVMPKIVINTLIRPNDNEIRMKKIPGKTLVYSGLYSTKKDIKILQNKSVIKYLRYRAKDMRGGYKKISSSLLKHDI